MCSRREPRAGRANALAALVGRLRVCRAPTRGFTLKRLPCCGHTI